MAASLSMIATVRRRTAESEYDTYSDLQVAEMIEAHPLPDAEGRLASDAEWVATYDLWATSAAIWGEKAAALAANYDFSADGASYSRSQAYQQAVHQASYCASRRTARGVAV